MTCFRPDICFIVSRLTQFMNNPTVVHLNLATNISRYLKGTKENCLKSENFELLRFCDSEWGTITDRKNTTGYCFKIDSN